MCTAFDFPLRGDSIPQDHGYLVFSGLSVKFPFLHGKKVQIAPIGGDRSADSRSIILNEKSHLHIRGLTNADALQMRGGFFWVGDHMLFLGPAHQRVIHPTPKLVSRLVVLRDVVSQEEVEKTLRVWMPEEGLRIEIGKSRALSMKGRHFKGYRVTLSGLTQERAEKVLSEGLGRLHGMGCGVFTPVWKG